MPRSRSIFIQSERVLRRSPLALTWPARLMAPPNSSSFSVSVVLPASGWEMIAKVRRRSTSVAIDEADSAPNDVLTGIFMAGWMWQFRPSRSRPDGLYGAGKLLAHDLKFKPMLFRHGDLPLEFCERGGDPFK